MLISVINLSQLADAEVQNVIRAVNRQLREDFTPIWDIIGVLRLEGHGGSRKPSQKQIPDMRGDAVLYIWDKMDVDGALGYHAKNYRGIPFGIVSTKLAEALKQPWSHTFSHEALELLSDPQCNLLVEGPHPLPRLRHRVFRWYEVCDPVQDEWYEIDGQVVSNFVLPLYFTEDNERSGRNAFHHHPKHQLRSFGTNPGGYVGYYDPKLSRHDTFSQPGDKVAQSILSIKSGMTGLGRPYRRANGRT